MVMDVFAKPIWAGIFQSMGAQFVTPPDRLQKKLIRIRALIFDWDGIFNKGEKGGGLTSHFTGPDSMGSSLLRFGLWLPQKKPMVAVITDVDNRPPMFPDAFSWFLTDLR